MHVFSKSHDVSAKMACYRANLTPGSQARLIIATPSVGVSRTRKEAVPVIEGKRFEAVRQIPFGQIDLSSRQHLGFHSSVGEEYSPPGPE